jgi:hypothetical protein
MEHRIVHLGELIPYPPEALWAEHTPTTTERQQSKALRHSCNEKP